MATTQYGASFDCQTPGLTVSNDCALQEKNGNSAVTVTVTNSGTAALANCKVTDTNVTGGSCATPPGLPVGGSAVAVSPNMFDLGVGAPAVTATGTITGLTENSCNTVSVTCDIVGSVDPNNPGHPKTLTATAQDTCATCSDTREAREPATATRSCFCTADLNPDFVTRAKDMASLDCQTPRLTVTKDCALRDTDGNSAVTITVTNTGTAELANCVVTDA